MCACFLIEPTYGINTYPASGDNNCSKDATNIYCIPSMERVRARTHAHTLHYAHHIKYTFCGVRAPEEKRSKCLAFLAC